MPRTRCRGLRISEHPPRRCGELVVGQPVLGRRLSGRPERLPATDPRRECSRHQAMTRSRTSTSPYRQPATCRASRSPRHTPSCAKAAPGCTPLKGPTITLALVTSPQTPAPQNSDGSLTPLMNRSLTYVLTWDGCRARSVRPAGASNRRPTSASTCTTVNYVDANTGQTRVTAARRLIARAVRRCQLGRYEAPATAKASCSASRHGCIGGNPAANQRALPSTE